MHFLVTGGAGFLGSALANRLRKDGHRVSVLDDLSNGERVRLHPEIEFKQGDIDNIPLLWSLLHDVDCVYHLAARVSVAESILYPRDYNHVNVAKFAKRLIDGGVSVHVGAHGQREGLAAHWEIWMFVQGGMTEMEALRSATLNPARYVDHLR